MDASFQEDNLVVHKSAKHRHRGTVQGSLLQNVRLNDSVLNVVLGIAVKLVGTDSLRYCEFFKICHHVFKFYR